MRNRRVQLCFGYPSSVFGVYDTGDGVIYIFGQHDGKIEDVLNHEVLHWAVQKAGGKKASLDLDNVPKELLRT